LGEPYEHRKENDVLSDAMKLKDATIATLTAEREALRAATRKVVEAGDIMSMLFEVHWTVKDTAEGVYASVWNWKVALSDPVIVALGRE